MKKFESKILRNKKFQDNNFIIEIEKPEGFTFEAGQFIMLYHDKSKRAFSIASTPSNETIEILMQMHEGGKVSPYYHEKKVGDSVLLAGPFGVFKIMNPNVEELVFISAGTGLAPLRSMLKDVLEKNPDKKVTLLFGFRNDYFFQEDLEELEKKHPNFKIHCSCSKPKDDWKGLEGRITLHIKELITSPEGKDVYITGPDKMMDDVRETLEKEIGFKEEQIHIEKWG